MVEVLIAYPDTLHPHITHPTTFGAYARLGVLFARAIYYKLPLELDVSEYFSS
jgi:hypothetical protein